MRGFHPRAWLHSLFTYPRFMGRIKPILLARTENEILAHLDALSGSWEPTRLGVPVGKRILVIAPHADDESLGAGGVLLAHRGKSEVHIINIFNGEGGGHLESGPWRDDPAYKAELVRVRQNELAHAARKIGAASVTHLGFPDGQHHALTIRLAEQLGEAVRKINPDVVFIPWFLDRQDDHKAANVLYAWGCADLNCMVFGYEVWRLCRPNAYFEITDFVAEKEALIRSYKTQNDFIDYATYMTALARTRAFLLGCHPERSGAAEAFLSMPNKAYCKIVLSLYGTPGYLAAARNDISR